jgi:tetratricopeptide (TPR) repeat protein
MIVLALSLVSGCNRHTHEEPLRHRTKDGRLAPVLKNLGDYRRPVTAKNDEAKQFFAQGLILIYAFNHAEALRSFTEMARLDPGNGMAYWGQALALAPNINDSAIGPDREQQGFQAIRQALSHKSGLTPVETGLIDALAARFAAQDKPDRAKLNQAYADAMKQLAARFPDDPDVAVLYADSVMNTMPWDYWDRATGNARPGVTEAIAAMERTIAKFPDHPGAHHLYIHAVEASPNPDRAVPSAEKLSALVPGAGHLVHMPSHIFIRVGRYADGSEVNRRAIAVDEDYITQCRAQGIYPAGYYPHNIHFLFATLSMEGKKRETLEAAEKVSTRHEHPVLKEPGFGFPHLLKAIPLFALVRFGEWDRVLAASDPGADQPFGRVIRHWARGMAFVAKKDNPAAARELELLRPLAAAPALAELKIFDINTLAQLSAIAVKMLEGEVAAGRGDWKEAVARLGEAVKLEEELRYSEPPDWPIPPRHYLGAVLLQAGRAADAEQVYRKDLALHRNNGWALRGLVASLEAQKKAKEARGVEQQFRKAWSGADIEIAGSAIGFGIGFPPSVSL